MAPNTYNAAVVRLRKVKHYKWPSPTCAICTCNVTFKLVLLCDITSNFKWVIYNIFFRYKVTSIIKIHVTWDHQDIIMCLWTLTPYAKFSQVKKCFLRMMIISKTKNIVYFGKNQWTVSQQHLRGSFVNKWQIVSASWDWVLVTVQRTAISKNKLWIIS